MEHHPNACRRCGTLLHGEDPDPLRHQLIEIPPITPVVIEHRLHRLVCPCCSTSTCAPLPAEVEASPYGPRLSALVGLLGSAFPVSFSKTQRLLDQLLGGGDQPWSDCTGPQAAEPCSGRADGRGAGGCPPAAGGLRG
ncbi:MAG: IS66 family transposase zinc-finger binding domain-containing protein [Cyanobium sp.]